MAISTRIRRQKPAVPPKRETAARPRDKTILRADGDVVVKASPDDGPKPARRALRVYAFDPSRGRRLGNHMTIKVKYEKLEKGLKGDQIEVIDYDASNKIYYKPAELNSVAALVEGGHAPSESDPRFHQQMVYAVAMNTIRTFEAALGRNIRYDFTDPDGTKRTHLRIFPHAMNEANAYYSRDLGALLFGYFRASEEDAGTGLPGGTVFTCLSHDIIAHETTHSIIDTMRRDFMVPTNGDVFAFHEAFSDIVALFQHFQFTDVVRDTLQRSGGVLHRFNLAPRGGNGDGKQPVFIVGEMPEGNPLLDLARQFGESMGRRAALRSALGIPPEPSAIKTLNEAHERGAILVAAVFDAFFSSFMQRSADLVRLARAVASSGDEIHPDIAARLAKEAAKTAGHFCTICIRAIDYCPPVDITFGEFLRALITADTDLYQSDAHEYRDALIQAFRARGIYPKDVASLAEESLLWNKPEPDTPKCPELCFDLTEPHKHSEENRQELERVVRAKPWFFGLCRDKEHKTWEQCNCPTDEGVVKSVNMVVRGGQDRPTVQFVAVIVGSIPHPDVEGASFLGGSTVVFDNKGEAKLIVSKNLSSEKRRNAQADFAEATLELMPEANYTYAIKPMGLSAIHRGY